MSHYTHLTIEEREKAIALMSQGKSQRAIATELGRNVSTISRELARNSKKSGAYSASWATEQYRRRRKRCHRKRLFENPQLAEYVIGLLQRKWSAEQIAERSKMEGYPIPFSFVSIYRAVAGRILPISLHKEMRIKRRHRSHKAGDKRGKIADCLGIHDRPKSVEKRKVIGHWESDTVLGKRTTGVIGTHVERKTGFLIAFKIPDRTEDQFRHATAEAFAKLPKKYKKSFTVDRGVEFYSHKELAQDTKMKVFFCDPHSPWQRGSNENTNGLLRQFFPKGSSFSHISELDLQAVVQQINLRPRKRLAWRSPFEAFFGNLLHLT